MSTNESGSSASVLEIAKQTMDGLDRYFTILHQQEGQDEESDVLDESTSNMPMVDSQRGNATSQSSPQRKTARPQNQFRRNPYKRRKRKTSRNRRSQTNGLRGNTKTDPPGDTKTDPPLLSP